MFKCLMMQLLQDSNMPGFHKPFLVGRNPHCGKLILPAVTVGMFMLPVVQLVFS